MVPSLEIYFTNISIQIHVFIFKKANNLIILEIQCQIFQILGVLGFWGFGFRLISTIGTTFCFRV